MLQRDEPPSTTDHQPHLDVLPDAYCFRGRCCRRHGRGGDRVMVSAGDESAWPPRVGAAIELALMQPIQLPDRALQPTSVAQRRLSARHSEKEKPMVRGSGSQQRLAQRRLCRDAAIASRLAHWQGRTHPRGRVTLGARGGRRSPAAAAERTAQPFTAPCVPRWGPTRAP